MFSIPLNSVKALVVVALTCTGCVSPWWNAFLDPTQMGNFRENVVNEIQQSISFRDKPTGIPAAVDPTPDDLLVEAQEYQAGAGDVLSIRMLDFLALGTESDFTPTAVDELGYIDISQLGWFNVEGMTARKLQAEIIRLSKEAGIYREDSEPTVRVSFVQRQQRQYNISGAIGIPGPYEIDRPDLTLRQAINRAGSLDPTIRTIYVFRGEQKHKQALEPSVYPATPIPPTGSEVPAPPVTPMTLMEVAAGPDPGAGQPQANPQSSKRNNAGGELALPPDQLEKELIEALTPGAPAGVPETKPAEAVPAAESPSRLPPFIFVDDKFVESPEAAQKQAAPQPVPSLEKEALKAPAESVDWEELAAEDQQRIIRIPAEKLRKGDRNYNIIIKGGDWILIDQGPVGVFYMGGHVTQPGTFALSGQPVTLTQAIFAAGGLDPLAWPTRCEIRRQIDGDREEITQWDLARIMSGQDPDLLIRPNDLVNVGTHAIAPLLATIRNSFRLSYGFGFVYDRNFADSDSMFPQQNPNDRRRNERNSLFRGLPFP